METTNVRRKRSLNGVVRSNKMDKTVVVEVTRMVKHKMYGKYVKKNARYKAHDERNECNIGDTVRIIECRPLSKDKNWRVQKILERTTIA